MFIFFYKKNLSILLFLGSIFILVGSCKKETAAIEEYSPTVITPTTICNFISFKMNGATCAFDTPSNTFFFAINDYEIEFSPLIEITEDSLEIFINEIPINNFATNDLGLVKVNDPLPVQFILCDGSEENYKLVFTNYPIIQIDTDGQFIHNDPKTPITFTLNDPDFLENGQLEQEYFSIAGLELRGGAAQNFPKKAYALELWEDSTGDEKVDAALLGMRDDDDWILDAMYIDKARMRNRASTDIWLEFHELHYQNEKPNAKSGTHGKMVEVFLDNQYWGIYAFTERLDRKLLKLETYETGGDYGSLFKSVHWENGTVKFENYFDFNPNSDYWEGWEQKYPDPEDGIFWDSLAELTQFVVESSDLEFQSQIGQKLHLDNVADYFIFLNLIRGDDNTGKNIYMTKFNQADRFFMLPWDMDATWGRFWDGSLTLTSDLLSNNLFDRLIATNADNFKNQLKQRWSSARNNVFTKNNLLGHFEKYAESMERNGAFERESTTWELEHNLTDEMNHLSTWIDGRLSYLDDYFGGL